MTSAVATADWLRREALRAVLRLEPLRKIFVSRARRVALAGAFCVVTSAIFATVAPGLALALGAAFLGVPHVLAGVRHQAVRRTLPPVSLAAGAAGLALGGAMLLGAGAWTMPALTVSFAVSAAAAVVRRRGIERVLGLAGVAAAAALALRWQPLFLVAVTHLHALGTLAWYSRAARPRGVPVWPLWALTLAYLALVAAGALDGWALHPPPWTAGPDAVLNLLGTPDVGAGTWARRGLLVYAFGQSLHYVVWLRLVPEIDRPSPTPWSFRRALAVLRADFGRWTVPALVLCAAAPVAMLGGGVAAREAYFALVYFHIGLEAASLLTPAASSTPP